MSFNTKCLQNLRTMIRLLWMLHVENEGSEVCMGIKFYREWLPFSALNKLNMRETLQSR